LFDRIIESHHYTEKDAARVMQEVMMGIGHMHEKMLVHRDLKPENLLLSTRDETASVKVADFGFARGTLTDHDLTSLVGTPPYMAPELVRLRHYDATGGYGRSVDVWALGVILYILLSGIHPFQIEDEEVMLDNIEHARWNWLGDNWDTVSDSAKDLLKQMLTQDPAKRPEISTLLKHPWIVNGGSSDRQLGTGVKDALKQFQARKKFKGAIRAIAATNRMRLAALSLKPRSESAGASDTSKDDIIDFHPYEDLVNGQPLPEGVSADAREKFMSDKEFVRIFGMDKEAFGKLPEEKRVPLKKDKKLL
jgi:serine/threonine protein kinase